MTPDTEVKTPLLKHNEDPSIQEVSCVCGQNLMLWISDIFPSYRNGCSATKMLEKLQCMRDYTWTTELETP